MNKDFEAQKMKLTVQFQSQIRELQATADRLARELDQKQKDMEKQEAEMRAAHQYAVFWCLLSRR